MNTITPIVFAPLNCNKSQTQLVLFMLDFVNKAKQFGLRLSDSQVSDQYEFHAGINSSDDFSGSQSNAIARLVIYYLVHPELGVKVTIFPPFNSSL